MKKWIVCLILLISNECLIAQKTGIKNSSKSANLAKPVSAVFKNAKDSISYAIGIRVAQNLVAQGFASLNLAVMNKAVNEIFQKKNPILTDPVIDQCINSYMETAAKEKSARARAAGKAFLENNAKRKGVITLPNGLQYEIIKDGTSTIKPLITDKIKCHYHGTLIDGTVFDSSVDRGEPAVFSITRVIEAWQQALPMMTVGSKWKLFVPAELGYGDMGSGPNIGPGATLIFEVEILGIEK